MLNDKGYYKLTYDEIVEKKIAKAKQLFGENINTSEHGVIGKIIRMDAYDLAKAYEDIEAAYYAGHISTASGVSLDRCATMVATRRNQATNAQRVVTIEGTAGTSVEEILVRGVDVSVVFHNIQPFTIPDGGSIDIIVECETAGTLGNVYVIDTVVNPVSGVSGVTYKGKTEDAEGNVLEDVDGNDIESDYEFRKRIMAARVGGSCNTDAITAAILRVPGVISAGTVENDTPDIDASGRPPHSIECFAYYEGDVKEEIAKAIFSKKAPGVPTCSTAEKEEDRVSVPVADISGNTHTIKFSKAGKVEMYVQVEYWKDSSFPKDGEKQIIQNLVTHINNLGLGVRPDTTRMYEYIYKVQGVTGVNFLDIWTRDENGDVRYDWEINRWNIAVTLPGNIELYSI